MDDIVKRSTIIYFFYFQVNDEPETEEKVKKEPNEAEDDEEFDPSQYFSTGTPLRAYST